MEHASSKEAQEKICKEENVMVSSSSKRIIGSRRRIIFTKAQKQEMHALHNEGMSQKDIGKRFNIGHSTVSIYLSTARKEKKKRYDTIRNSEPEVVFKQKLHRFNQSLLPPAPITRNDKTQMIYSKGYSCNTVISKKLYKFLYAEGKMEGINMTIKLKELMDKLWPGEDNGSEKIGRKTVLKRTNFWTKCALSGRDINLAARREEPGKGSLDHKIPRDQGGTSDLDNCQPLSVRMNQMKGNMTNEEFKEEIKFLYARFFLN